MANIKLENVRLSYNSIFEAQDFEGDQNFAYNAKVIIEKGSEADKKIRAALLEVANAEFANKGAETIKKVAGDPAQYCYQPMNGDANSEYMVLATKRKAKAGRPLIIDANRAPLTEDDGKPYAGCFINILVKPWAMASKGKHWIRCGLEGIQFVRDGESFGSRASVSDFDDVSVFSNETVEDLL
jgi:hypothetical protein